MGLLVISLLFGAIVQSFGKRKNQTDLGNIGLATCTVVTFLAGLMGIHMIVGLVTMTGFILAINAKK
jgi:4-hydroxybenzoate polyprenyltransferase